MDKKPDILHKVCIICGKAYDTPRSNPRKTCSPDCAFAARSRAHKGKDPNTRADLTGQTFGELTAVRRLDNGKWLWHCSCGKDVERMARAVIYYDGDVSCGHVKNDKAKSRIVEDNVLGDYDGTRISTLKSITSGKKRSTNTSGVTGVVVRHRVAMDVYQARIEYQGKTINLGTYPTLHEAEIARKLAEKKYFGGAIAAYEAEQKNK